ncbi:MAG: hypothetical protein JXA13_15645 [Anaerolineales bacterium]|nr:hypothetical protein [Anaerolineales bacterium]
MGDRILTLHPRGKAGSNIDKVKYEKVRAVILEVLQECGAITLKDLLLAVDEKLSGNFDGSIGWYTTTIKLDLEARGEIECVPGSKPQTVRLGPMPPE